MTSQNRFASDLAWGIDRVMAAMSEPQRPLRPKRVYDPNFAGTSLMSDEAAAIRMFFIRRTNHLNTLIWEAGGDKAPEAQHYRAKRAAMEYRANRIVRLAMQKYPFTGPEPEWVRAGSLD
jgi:hypothetical protein